MSQQDLQLYLIIFFYCLITSTTCHQWKDNYIMMDKYYDPLSSLPAFIFFYNNQQLLIYLFNYVQIYFIYTKKVLLIMNRQIIYLKEVLY